MTEPTTCIFCDRQNLRRGFKPVDIPNSKPLFRGVLNLEGPVGLEPTTLCLKGRCSNRLSYGPAKAKAFASEKQQVIKQKALHTLNFTNFELSTSKIYFATGVIICYLVKKVNW